MKRVTNLEGAFPLLLVGSALLVYAAILANEEMVVHGAHLPLWGLIGAVGMVVVGAGVYSTFLEEPASAAPLVPPDAVVISKSEYDALKGDRPPPRPPSSTPKMPEWWEGPPEPRTAERAGPVRVSVPPAEKRPAAVPPVVPSALRRGGPPGPLGVGAEATPKATPARLPAPPPPRPAATPPRPRRSLTELKSALSELETLLDQEFAASPRTAPKPAPKGVPACADCRRALPKLPTPNVCSGCGKSLCTDCALSSQFEDGDLRCIECRAHDPWPRGAAR